jgi:hypothetical protein
LFLAGLSCSDGEQTKIDYTVRFTDVNNVDRGEAAPPGSFSSLQAAQSVMLKGSSATLEIKSDMAGLHFDVLEGQVRRGALVCSAGKGSGVAQANAPIGAGGHYLITVTYKGASCVAVQ